MPAFEVPDMPTEKQSGMPGLSSSPSLTHANDGPRRAPLPRQTSSRDHTAPGNSDDHNGGIYNSSISKRPVKVPESKKQDSILTPNNVTHIGIRPLFGLLASKRFDISPNGPTPRLEDDDVFGPTLKVPLTYPGPVSTFPHPRPPPHGLDLRVENQLPALRHLDRTFHHPPMWDPELDDIPVEGCSKKEASEITYDKINDHIANRLEYVKLASRRYNQQIAMLNERPFDLPITGDYVPIVQDDLHGTLMAKSLPTLWSALPEGDDAVDLKTGKGLREYMQLMSKQYKGRNTQCLSITFQDFTINMKTHQPLNERLGHYESDGSKKRIDAWEVVMPMITHDSKGEETITKTTWLWILLELPFISSFNPSERRTKPVPPPYGAPPSPPAVTRSINDPELLGLSSTSSSSDSDDDDDDNDNDDDDDDDEDEDEEPVLQAPFAFPDPMPSSWVVFALPLAHAGAHPTVEDLELAPSPNDISAGKRIYRRDFDMSHSGVPIFEYSNVTEPIEVAFIGGVGRALRMKMVSIDKMGECYEGFERLWWNNFNTRVDEEEKRWKRIEKTMAKGACRVVLRWEGRSDRIGFGFAPEIKQRISSAACLRDGNRRKKKKFAEAKDFVEKTRDVVKKREAGQGTEGGTDEVDVDKTERKGKRREV